MIKKINHYWRIIATGICFSYFGIGALVLTLLVFPFQKLIYQNKSTQKKVARRTVHVTFKWFIAFMQCSGVFKFELDKVQPLKKLRGHLILANHPSLIDVVVLISVIPNADCVVKAHLFKNPFLRGVVSNTGYISNKDPEGLLNDCSETLAAGNNLIIFPEGTRTQKNKSVHFLRGASNIAVRCQSKITCVIIDLQPSTLTKSEPWYKVPPRRAHFKANIVNGYPALPTYNLESISQDVRQFNRELEAYFIHELENV
ncbi:MAG: lysophospholipid acyltransferase family protein [Kangiellaceae bacterium]